MNKEHIAVKNPDLTCCKCLEEKSIRKITIPSKGYGSGFDSWSTQINLCDDCYSATNSEWWELRDSKPPSNEDWHGDVPYEYEDEIFKFIKSLPLAGQEMIDNTYSTDSYACWEQQDWIDYQLGSLPHEKCKDYGVYSNDEIEAYETRFPSCEHTFNVIYNEKSKGCQCPFGAFGEYGGKTDINTSDECYGCIYYKKRETPIKDIEASDVNDYMSYKKFKIKESEYVSKFENQ